MIKKNTLLGKYVGQIYNYAIWLYKERVIRKIKTIPDQVFQSFYNTQLERFQDDNKGFEVFQLNPIPKGNWCCRINHSCNPNCIAKTMIANGKYEIGIYALRRIESGEELTWNYLSLTTNRDEYEKGLCYFGKIECLGRYFQYQPEEYREFDFSSRIYSLMYCISWDTFTEKMLQECQLLKLNPSLWNQSPLWLKVWLHGTTVGILNKWTLSEESEKDLLLEKWKKELAICLSQIREYLKLVDSDLRPISALSPQEEFEYLWGDWEFSIKMILKGRYQQFPKIFEFLSDPMINTSDLARFQLLKMRDVLKNIEGNRWINHGVADILYLIASTQKFYKLNKYPKVSIELPILRCEINEEYYNEEPYVGNKELIFDEYYLPLMLIGWHNSDYAFKYDNFALEIRGTVNLADFLMSEDFEYTTEARNKFLKKIEDHPLNPWIFDENYIGPVIKSNNFCTIFGSPMLEKCSDNGFKLETCLNALRNN